MMVDLVGIEPQLDREPAAGSSKIDVGARRLVTAIVEHIPFHVGCEQHRRRVRAVDDQPVLDLLEPDRT